MEEALGLNMSGSAGSERGRRSDSAGDVDGGEAECDECQQSYRVGFGLLVACGICHVKLHEGEPGGLTSHNDFCFSNSSFVCTTT